MLIEDGSGLTNSDTYADIAFVDTYHTKLLNTAWIELTDNAVKEAYVYKAMNYIEAVYGQKWVGTTLNDTQALTMPRLLDGETIYPVALQNAVCELALKSISGELLIDVEQRVLEEQVSSIKVKYAEYSDQLTQYSFVYQLLMPYLENSSSVSHSVVRV
jgi:hypothetical protein